MSFWFRYKSPPFSIKGKTKVEDENEIKLAPHFQLDSQICSLTTAISTALEGLNKLDSSNFDESVTKQNVEIIDITVDSVHPDADKTTTDVDTVGESSINISQVDLFGSSIEYKNVPIADENKLQSSFNVYSVDTQPLPEESNANSILISPSTPTVNFVTIPATPILNETSPLLIQTANSQVDIIATPCTNNLHEPVLDSQPDEIVPSGCPKATQPSFEFVIPTQLLASQAEAVVATPSSTPKKFCIPSSNPLSLSKSSDIFQYCFQSTIDLEIQKELSSMPEYRMQTTEKLPEIVQEEYFAQSSQNSPILTSRKSIFDNFNLDSPLYYRKEESKKQESEKSNDNANPDNVAVDELIEEIDSVMNEKEMDDLDKQRETDINSANNEEESNANLSVVCDEIQERNKVNETVDHENKENINDQGRYQEQTLDSEITNSTKNSISMSYSSNKRSLVKGISARKRRKHDNPSPSTVRHAIGSRVWCRWKKNGMYYPAIVKNVDENDAYSIEFLDGSNPYNCGPDDVFEFNLKVGDEILLYAHSKALFEEARVISIERDTIHITYNGANTTTDVSSIFLNQDQFNQNGVVTDSQLVGKRIHLELDKFMYSGTIVLKEANIFSIILDNGEFHKSTKESIHDLEFRKGAKVSLIDDNQIYNIQNTIGSTPILELDNSKYYHPKDVKLLKSEEEIHQVDQLFAGREFMLTLTEKELKEAISKSILEHGGNAVEIPKTVNDVYLIAKEPKRTFKYLLALALGIPRVSVDWINDSLSQKRMLPINKYLLPNGTSKTTGANINHTSVNHLFNDMCFIVFGAKTFKQEWTKILSSAGAHVFPDTQYIPLKSTLLYCLSDGKPTKRILESIKKRQTLRCLYLKKEYLIQCLICQQVIDDLEDYVY